MSRFVLVCVAVATACACSRGGDARSLSTIDAVNAALRRGDAIDAEALAARALAAAKPPDGEIAWRLRLLRADALVARRDFQGALSVAPSAVPEGPAFAEIRARQKYLQAKIALGQGRLPDALALASEARMIASAGSELELEIAAFRGQLGLQLGRWADAERQLADVVARASSSGHRYVEALARNAYGMGKFVRNRYDEALPFFEHIVATREIADTSVYAKALYNAGMCYSRLGEFDRAIEIQRRAVGATERRPASSDYEQALGQLGNTYLLNGNPRDGLAYIERAYKAASASESKLIADAALWAGNLAKAYIDLGRWDDAERFHAEAARFAAAARSDSPIYNVERSAEIAAGRGRLDEATTLFEQVVATDDAPPPILWDAYFGLANIAIARKQPERAAKSFEAALDVIEKTRAGLLKPDYKLAYLTQLIVFYRAYVDLLIARGEVERALAVADSSRGRVLAERQDAPAPARATGAQMRDLARRSGATYLSYWLTPAHSYVWVVTASGIRCLTLPPAPEIERLVREHQATIANALADPLSARESAGDALFRTIVAPAVDRLAPGASVVVVPDGALYGINFETLPVAAGEPARDAAQSRGGDRGLPDVERVQRGGDARARTRRYWLEDVEIQIAPSLASLIAAKPAATRADRSALIVGNAVGRPPEFPELRYASAEMTGIARHFEPDRTSVFERDRATPDAYRAARPDGFRFVHFAAHATANVESPLDSAVILSGPETAYKLYAREVAAQPLTAELVTVSACRSAGERAYSGEGLVGFAWAFLRAGARRVIAGLWDVSDRSTAVLMERLYAGLAAGDPPPRALRNAKLELIRQGGAGAAPYAWGAFELFTVTPSF